MGVVICYDFVLIDFYNFNSIPVFCHLNLNMGFQNLNIREIK